MEGYNQKKNKPRKTTVVLEYLEFGSQRAAICQHSLFYFLFSVGLLENDPQKTEI